MAIKSTLKIFFEIVLVIIFMLGVLANIVSGATSTNITITFTPLTSEGINSFLITYVSDTDILLSWTLGASVDKIMVRAKYGEYPANIPDINTAPTDGYLVYYGNGTEVHDTSMNFDENAGVLYYRAWAQQADGTWNMNTSSGSKESKEVVLIALLFAPIALAGLGAGLKNGMLCYLAIPLWLACGFWIGTNYTWFGGAQMPFAMLLAFGASIGMAFEAASVRPKAETEDGGEVDPEIAEQLAAIDSYQKNKDLYYRLIGGKKKKRGSLLDGG